MTDRNVPLEAGHERPEDDPMPIHDNGCRCWPHVSQRDAVHVMEAVALAEYRDGLRRRPPHAEGPWFRQGLLVHGPDKGGIDIGPLLAEFADENDAAYVVSLVNREWRRHRG